MIQTTQSFIDSYDENLAQGKVIGKKNSSGIIRKGIDTEGIISIDHHAIRIQPLNQPGWGRSGIAYGPYNRVNGLTFATFILNGHNTSEAGNIMDSIIKRLLYWGYGSGANNPLRQVIGWLRSPYKRRMWRRFIYWFNNTPQRCQLPKLRENLAIGWFPNEVPSNPLTEGNGFIIHATTQENGELKTRIGTNILSAFKGLQNIPIYYIVILREKGAAYYAASLPHSYGLGDYPNMRPIAIDPCNDDQIVYGGIYQSVLGEIGFTVDTRVYGTQIEQLSELATWYGTAMGADSLIGDRLIKDSSAEVGGFWQSIQGNFKLTAKGAVSLEKNSFAVLNLDCSVGLVHTLINTSDEITASHLIWRFQDENNFWSWEIRDEGCQLQIQEQGKWHSIAVSEKWCLHPNKNHSLQILDDGERFSLYLNGELVFNNQFEDVRLNQATGVGIFAKDENQKLYFRDFEAHPRSISIPNSLNLASPWQVEGKEVIFAEDFSGSAGDLANKLSNTGEKIWRKEMGKGVIELTGNNSAKVQATVKHPNPNRTAYTVSWENQNFADVTVDIIPPGTKRRQGEEGRGGLIFWQDRGNYMIINNWLNNGFGAASISSFFSLNGFEDLYDAVWTNIGNRVTWGVCHQLRVIFDGNNYTVFVNDEPVLYRALTDVYPLIKGLSINKIGIVANWEWGRDTGTVFKNFMAKI
ncbi:nucleotide-binding protein [Hydrocoleum sp. CS-953]|uniref:nucleotide-binding protein n=1 Tax=Hydrocoleum sp. CS-953 TaxID=1671698 RepID=UPI000B9BBBB6|nr:nucleotide-binding protein [Hydrocoleum sp. CS-953]OZH51998.1 nucleotide-binding protein [Hydrocoleum sp. CS-953]